MMCVVCGVLMLKRKYLWGGIELKLIGCFDVIDWLNDGCCVIVVCLVCCYCCVCCWLSVVFMIVIEYFVFVVIGIVLFCVCIWCRGYIVVYCCVWWCYCCVRVWMVKVVCWCVRKMFVVWCWFEMEGIVWVWLVCIWLMWLCVCWCLWLKCVVMVSENEWMCCWKVCWSSMWVNWMSLEWCVNDWRNARRLAAARRRRIEFEDMLCVVSVVL